MFERFTDEARQVVVHAQEEARALGHDSVDGVHLLLGILRLPGDGAAAGVLHSVGVTLPDARDQVVRLEGRREPLETGQLPFTRDAQLALEESLREAQELGDQGIGAEHLLLALVRNDEGRAAHVLLDFDVAPQRVRARLHPRLGQFSVPDEAVSPAAGEPERTRRSTSPLLGIVAGWFAFGAAVGIGLLLGWLIWG